MRVTTSGTLGDSYIVTCKLLKLKDKIITIEHYTECKYWKKEIKDIYGLNPNVEVDFVDTINDNLQYMHPHSKVENNIKQDMEYFPEFKNINNINNKFNFKDYILIQANAGKPFDAPLSKGGTTNTKLFGKELLDQIIDDNSNRLCVLVGTENQYEGVGNCLNLVNKLTILEAIYLAQNCDAYIGLEGLLSFVSLSNKNKTIIFFVPDHLQAIDCRIINTPWEQYCEFFILENDCIRKATWDHTDEK